MRLFQNLLAQGKTNFIFIGGAGTGKSEIALNTALWMAEFSRKPVHFFDMDMTKPLYRSRDAIDEKIFCGISFHFEEQFYDAPTLVGGVRELMRDPHSITIMDAGGDGTGARSIGGFLLGPRRKDTAVFYVLNVYRPFCADLEHIDCILGEILAASHIEVEELHLLHNPNLGMSTTAEEVLAGAAQMEIILSGVKDVELLCVKAELHDAVKGRLKTEVMPVRLFLTYPWLLC